MIEYEKLAPQEGKQELMMRSEADILLYGGGAGSGKTYALLLECLRHKDVPGFFTLFLRRTKSEIKLPGGPVDESRNMFSMFPDMEYSEAYMLWKFHKNKPNTGKLQFAGIELEKDLENFKGSQVPLTISGFME